MASPPARIEISDNYPLPSDATARIGFGRLYDYVTGLLGATGAKPEALAALGAYGASNILGTVSQTAGVPTGAIIEQGSNANGSYTRWADGTQICKQTLNYPATNISTAAGSMFYCPGTVAGTPYAAGFVGALPVNAIAVANDAGLVFLGSASLQSLTNYQSTYLMRATANTSDNVRVNLIAIGRWF